jgi:hypothetical protein
MSDRHTVLYDPEGRIDGELPLDRTTHDARQRGRRDRCHGLTSSVSAAGRRRTCRALISPEHAVSSASQEGLSRSGA